MAPMKTREILRLLMKSEGITEYGLSESTGVNKSTINAILSGRSAEQRVATLEPLAKHFHITPEQLRGNDPIEGIHQGRKSYNEYPIVTDQEVKRWLDEKTLNTDYSEFVVSAHPKGRKCFVYRAGDDAMSPKVLLGDYVFVDPDFVYPKGEPVKRPKIALIEADGHLALRSESLDVGQVVYRAMAPGFRTIMESECSLVGYVTGMPEQAWADDVSTILKSR